MKKIVALLWLALIAIPALASAQLTDWLIAPLWAVDPSMPPEWQRDLPRQRQAIIHAKWNVRIDLQMIALDEARALELLPQLQSTNQPEVEAACERLQRLIRAGEATLIAWPMLCTMDGSGAASETVLEKRYSTEFEPPQQPQTLSALPPTPGPIRKDTTEGLPNAYETRNLEVTFEAWPTVLGDGHQLHVGLRISRVSLLGFDDFGYALTVHNTVCPAPQPRFLGLKSNVELKLRSGQRQLVAVHKLPAPDGRIELHLVRAVVRPAE